MIEKGHEHLSITSQCEILGLNRSSFYYVPIGESEENLKIMNILDEQYFNVPFYGVLRLTALLIGLGYKVNAKRSYYSLIHKIKMKTVYPWMEKAGHLITSLLSDYGEV